MGSSTFFLFFPICVEGVGGRFKLEDGGILPGLGGAGHEADRKASKLEEVGGHPGPRCIGGRGVSGSGTYR